MRLETLNRETVAAFAAGALAMFLLESLVTRSRRARVAGHHDRATSHRPHSDAQLRQRVTARLGHLVSHPGAIDVSVSEGIVRVSGQVLAQELDGLLTQLTQLPGVHKVHNALGVLHDPSGFGEARSGHEPA